MARLNEAPVPTESIDALKRRFIRQNRELAKNNSAQCLRIRALECEVSRLLSENLDLRENILRLQADVEAAQPRTNSVAIVSVKDQLEAKLHEFSVLISELGNVRLDQPPHQHAVAGRRERDPASWRPEAPLAALSGQSNIMSEIAEEKASPGGTLRNEDVRVPRLSNQSNESPELGPPPVAHFECDDPIKFDPDARSNGNAVGELNNNDIIDPSLAVNLETRRRRRDTYSRADTRPSSAVPSDADDDEPTTRPSAKRKLSIREAEDADVKPPKDDFVFSRRTSVNGDVRKNLSSVESSVGSIEMEKKATDDPPKLAAKTERRVLGDKSVNMSPRKTSRAKNTKDDANKTEKPARDGTRGQGRERKLRVSIVKPLQAADEVLPTIELARSEASEQATSMPSKTPAAELFSPTPSEPSAVRLDGRDTPPPSGLRSANSTSSALTGASRPSRRARAAVNYAEPNLISKMRRPTKTLADAVALGSRQSMSNVPESESKLAMRTVVIKQEDGGSTNWKTAKTSGDNGPNEAGSPLGRKSSKAQEDMLRQTQSGQDMAQSSACGKAIAALMADKTTTKPEIKVEDDANKSQEMDLYDFKDSSPGDMADDKVAIKPSSRRHSSMSGQAAGRDVARRRMSKMQQQLPVLDTGEGQMVGSEGIDTAGARKIERTTARRRSMMV